MKTSPGKLRTREHVIADLGINCLERHILLCGQRPNQKVAPRHLEAVRTMLDAKGLLDGEKFDRLVADAVARHSVSG
jgi:hypothetical protein